MKVKDKYPSIWNIIAKTSSRVSLKLEDDLRHISLAEHPTNDYLNIKHTAEFDWIVHYVMTGENIGGLFVDALLSNNLVRAFRYADEHNMKHMDEWAKFLWHEMPHGCLRPFTDDHPWPGWIAKRTGNRG